MPGYRRYYVEGGIYFFTVVTHMRRPLFIDGSTVELLKQCLKTTMNIHPFTMNALVILPDHLHTIWTLPDNDSDYSTRWKITKAKFSRHYRSERNISTIESRISKGEKGIWQRRFWEHLIRSQEDYNKHLDYIHYNPVKHGLVDFPLEWKQSSFHKYVKWGVYGIDWGKSVSNELIEMNLE